MLNLAAVLPIYLIAEKFLKNGFNIIQDNTVYLTVM